MQRFSRKHLHRLALFVGAAAIVASGTGCAFTPYQAAVIPPRGVLFNHYQAPLTTNFNGNPVGPNVRVVSSSYNSYFRDFFITTGLFELAWDRSAIAGIARNAGMSEIYYADYEVLNVLGIYGRFTVHVYGN
jgi:hypothetical protein